MTTVGNLTDAGNKRIQWREVSIRCICPRILTLNFGRIIKFKWKYQQKAPKFKKEGVLYQRKHDTVGEEEGVDERKTGRKGRDGNEIRGHLRYY